MALLAREPLALAMWAVTVGVVGPRSQLAFVQLLPGSSSLCYGTAALRWPVLGNVCQDGN